MAPMPGKRQMARSPRSHLVTSCDFVRVAIALPIASALGSSEGEDTSSSHPGGRGVVERGWNVLKTSGAKDVLKEKVGHSYAL